MDGTEIPFLEFWKLLLSDSLRPQLLTESSKSNEFRLLSSEKKLDETDYECVKEEH
jgi:hypothetical protein